MVHIHCGGSSAETLRRAGLPGEVVVFGDPVAVGPTPAGLTAEEWRAVRAQFLFGAYGRGGVAKMERWLAAQDEALARSLDHEEVVLWFDACMFDQTILIRLLDWFSRRGLGDTRLALIAVGEFPGMPHFRGLGELDAGQMASLFPTRQDVTPEQLALAREAWTAYCAPDPTALDALLRGDTSPLRYLADALRRHLQQFPFVGTGLDRVETAVLDALAASVESPVPLFLQVSDSEERPWLGDAMLWAIINDLAAEATPLLVVDGPGGRLPTGDPPAAPLGPFAVRLTDAGRAVLAGGEDRVRLNGLHRWVGGVHPQGRGSEWRWDEAASALRWGL